MDQSKRDEWCAKLRSGEFKQGTGALKQYGMDGKCLHCCLGVLCHITPGGKWAVAHTDEDGCRDLEESSDGTYFIFDGDTNAELLPDTVAVLHGLQVDGTLHGLTDRENNVLELTTLNDDGFTFAQIADVIEHFL